MSTTNDTPNRGPSANTPFERTIREGHPARLVKAGPSFPRPTVQGQGAPSYLPLDTSTSDGVTTLVGSSVDIFSRIAAVTICCMVPRSARDNSLRMCPRRCYGVDAQSTGPWVWRILGPPSHWQGPKGHLAQLGASGRYQLSPRPSAYLTRC
ncbi:UNVERIFIED_CONTAM: hypothetical protein Slati_0200700 [Sesamum latifolium]|uniref:Uncharacterized protein n=1 Tax=Sesamum latifolium TaxID=2727402 RepID=A0AAW2YBV3_9LAMI